MIPLDAAFAAITAACPVETELSARAKGLMVGYDVRWRSYTSRMWRSVSEEEQFQIPIINPETGSKSRTFSHAGKRDGIISNISTGEQFLRECKTTSEDISDPASAFFQCLAIDAQISGYIIQSWMNGVKIAGTMYDMTFKPKTKLKQIPKTSKAGIGHMPELESGTYFGFQTDEQPDEDGKETPALYLLRVAYDCIQNPDKYFQRRIISRSDSDLAEYADELWDISKDILAARKRGRWGRETGHCNKWGRVCEYLPLCSGQSTVITDSWEPRSPLHPELSGVEGDVLTHSSMKCFGGCKRQYFYKFEEGIQPLKTTESEALYFGKIYHLGQEAWWKCFRKKGE